MNVRIVFRLLRSVGIRISSSKSTSAFAGISAPSPINPTVAPETSFGIRNTPEFGIGCSGFGHGGVLFSGKGNWINPCHQDN